MHQIHEVEKSQAAELARDQHVVRPPNASAAASLGAAADLRPRHDYPAHADNCNAEPGFFHLPAVEQLRRANQEGWRLVANEYDGLPPEGEGAAAMVPPERAAAAVVMREPRSLFLSHLQVAQREYERLQSSGRRSMRGHPHRWRGGDASADGPAAVLSRMRLPATAAVGTAKRWLQPLARVTSPREEVEVGGGGGVMRGGGLAWVWGQANASDPPRQPPHSGFVAPVAII